MTKLEHIEGVGDAYAQKLQAVGITTAETLLEKGSTAKGRKEIADQSGLSEKLILRWINHLDLARIKGISAQYSELLEASGADTVPDLARRKAENLLRKMEEVNDQKNLVRKLPSLSQLSDWIEEAKTLPRVITH